MEKSLEDYKSRMNAAVSAYIDKYWLSRKCPYCGHEEWEAEGMIIHNFQTVTLARPNQRKVALSDILPRLISFPVRCVNCYQRILVDPGAVAGANAILQDYLYEMEEG